MKSGILKIITLSDGERSEFASEATVEIIDGVYRIKYTVEGDNAFLSWNGTCLRMERYGDVSLEAEFIVSERTEMFIRSSQGCGRIPIVTSKLSKTENDATISFSLIYDFIFGKEFKRFQLEISA